MSLYQEIWRRYFHCLGLEGYCLVLYSPQKRMLYCFGSGLAVTDVILSLETKTVQDI